MFTVNSFSGEDLDLLACKAGKLHLGKESFLEVPRGSPEARAEVTALQVLLECKDSDELKPRRLSKYFMRPRDYE
jgi:hypothetical protein